jgi:hypothetical protein
MHTSILVITKKAHTPRSPLSTHVLAHERGRVVPIQQSDQSMHENSPLCGCLCVGERGRGVCFDLFGIHEALGVVIL